MLGLGTYIMRILEMLGLSIYFMRIFEVIGLTTAKLEDFEALDVDKVFYQNQATLGVMEEVLRTKEATIEQWNFQSWGEET